MTSRDPITQEVHEILKGLAIRAGCAAGATGAICVHLALTSPASLADLTGWLLNRTSFFILFYLALASAGVMLTSAGPQWRYASQRMWKVADQIASLYAGIAGATLGCAITCCVGAAATNPSHAWLAVLVGTMMLTVMIAPLHCFLLARITAASLSDRWYAKAWRLNAVRGIGYVFVVLSAIGAWHDILVYAPSA